MSIVVLGRGADFNLILTDAIVMAAPDSAYPDGTQLVDKIFNDPLNERWFGLVGDGLGWNALRVLIYWANAKHIKLNFREYKTAIDLGMAAGYYAQSLRRKQIENPRKPSHFTLFVCDRQEPFYWGFNYNEECDQWMPCLEMPVITEPKPTIIKPNKLLINYKGYCPEKDFSVEFKEAIPAVKRLVEDIDAQQRSQGNGLPYPLNGRFSAAVVPLDRHQKVITEIPFRFASECILGCIGGKENWEKINSGNG